MSAGTVATRVAVLRRGTTDVEVREIELPPPGPHQVRVRQHATGVCHSQLHQIHRAPDQNELLGHESVGVVEAVGEQVTGLGVGDSVVVTWLPRLGAMGERPSRVPGFRLDLGGGEDAVVWPTFTWSDYTVVDEQYVVAIPDDLPRLPMAVLGCAVMTGAGAVVNSTGVRPRDSVAVWGAGGVGLSAVMAAHAIGAYPIVVVDLDDEKLEFARTFGATHVVNGSRVDPVEAVRDLTRRSGFHTLGAGRVPGEERPTSAGADFAFDCIGRDATIKQVVAAARCSSPGVFPGGTAVVVGKPGGPIEIDILDMYFHEKRLLGSMGGSSAPQRHFPLFLDWYRAGLLKLDELVTRTYPLQDVSRAIADLESGEVLGRAVIELD